MYTYQMHVRGSRMHQSIRDPESVGLVFLEKPCYGFVHVGRAMLQRLRTLRGGELEAWSIPFGRTTCTLLYTPCIMTH